MPREKLSAAARKRISLAAKRYWANYRKAKATGQTPTGRGKPGRKRGRPAKATTSDLGGMQTDALVTMRRRIDQELADRVVLGQA